jgi:hypothetical protein
MMIKRLSFLAVSLLALAGTASAVNVAIDPGLEDAGMNGFPVNPPPGPLAPGWVGFTGNGANVVGTTTSGVFDGVYSGELIASAPASNAVLKNGNVGIGIVQPNADVTISFWARGSSEAGGVAFAEFFSELEGGGTSQSEILGGGPLAVTDDWTQFIFNTVTGPDVGGGITLQFAAIAGGDVGSFSELFVDNISIEVAPIPLPAGGLLFGSAMGLLGWARRRAS